MSLSLSFHHRPLESSLKKRRRHRSWQVIQTQLNISRIITVFLVGSFLICCGYIFRKAPWFRVQEITCSTQFSSQCEEAVLGELAQGKGRHLYMGNWVKEIQNIQQANPSYFTFSIERRFPSTIHVKVTISPPRYILKYDNDQKIITEAGSVIFSDHVEQIPHIALTNELWNEIEGQTILPETNHQRFLEIATCLTESRTSLKRISWITDNEVRGLLSDEKTVIITPQNCPAQLKQLEIIVAYPLEQAWTEADLRFSKPVLR